MRRVKGSHTFLKRAVSSTFGQKGTPSQVTHNGANDLGTIGVLGRWWQPTLVILEPCHKRPHKWPRIQRTQVYCNHHLPESGQNAFKAIILHISKASSAIWIWYSKDYTYREKCPPWNCPDVSLLVLQLGFLSGIRGCWEPIRWRKQSILPFLFLCSANSWKCFPQADHSNHT